MTDNQMVAVLQPYIVQNRDKVGPVEQRSGCWPPLMANRAGAFIPCRNTAAPLREAPPSFFPSPLCDWFCYSIIGFHMFLLKVL
jgi:hypothetical protein